MGAVYEAKHILIGRRLAVKFLHSQYATNDEVVIRFQREAQAAAAIGHENIIEVTDMGTTPDGAPYLVMEYLDGMDIRELLADQGVLPVEQTAHIMLQALSALHAAHEVGIIHRDLKPENIYLIEKSERKDYVKLLDFGISKFRTLEADGMKGLTQTGTVLGTPYYMSPEQARGDQGIGPKSDIYAMGVILFQMLTGVLPFDAPNYNALLIKILTEDPPHPADINPELPPDLVETICIAMAREPEDRFSDCLHFRERLLQYVPGASSVFRTKMSAASRTAVQAALSDTHTPLEMTRSGGMAAPRSRAPLIVGAVLSTLAAAAAAVFFLVIKQPVPTPVPPLAPVVAPAASEVGKTDKAAEAVAQKDETVEIKIAAKPEKSVISIDGIVAAGNPYIAKVNKDSTTHKVEISAEGYEPILADVQFDTNRELAYTLTKMEKKKRRSDRRRSDRKRSSRSEKRASKEEKKAERTTQPAEKTSKKPRRKIDDEDPWK
jgi:serine/threonine-protein kinase